MYLSTSLDDLSYKFVSVSCLELNVYLRKKNNSIRKYIHYNFKKSNFYTEKLIWILNTLILYQIFCVTQSNLKKQQ